MGQFNIDVLVPQIIHIFKWVKKEVKCILITVKELTEYRVTSEIYLSVTLNRSSVPHGNQAVPTETI